LFAAGSKVFKENTKLLFDVSARGRVTDELLNRKKSICREEPFVFKARDFIGGKFRGDDEILFADQPIGGL
jgi:hypothetical protein